MLKNADVFDVQKLNYFLIRDFYSTLQIGKLLLEFYNDFFSILQHNVFLENIHFLMRVKTQRLYWGVLHKFSISFWKTNLLSIVIPKSITSLLSLTEFITIHYLLSFFWFSIINWDFPALAFNEFVLNQNEIFFISNIRFSLMSNKFLSHEYRVWSSAMLHISDFSIKKNISFMNILNSSRPNIDPWGIPRNTYD